MESYFVKDRILSRLGLRVAPIVIVNINNYVDQSTGATAGN
jgi:hypothetical protein